MRTLHAFGAIVMLAGCTAAPAPAPVVSWQYGTGNGDGVSYSGNKPTYVRAYGAGSGDGVQSGQTARTQYGYGADGQTGGMVQMVAPPPPTVVAAPAGSAGTHS